MQTYFLNRCGNFKLIYHLQQEHLNEKKQKINENNKINK